MPSRTSFVRSNPECFASTRSSIALSSFLACSSSRYLFLSSFSLASTVMWMLSYFYLIWRSVADTSLFSSSPNSHEGITLLGSRSVFRGTKLYQAVQSSSLNFFLRPIIVSADYPVPVIGRLYYGGAVPGFAFAPGALALLRVGVVMIYMYLR